MTHPEGRVIAQSLYHLERREGASSVTVSKKRELVFVFDAYRGEAHHTVKYL